MNKTGSMKMMTYLNNFKKNNHKRSILELKKINLQVLEMVIELYRETNNDFYKEYIICLDEYIKKQNEDLKKI